MISFGNLDAEQVYPIYNNHNLGQIIVKQMEVIYPDCESIEELQTLINDSSTVKETSTSFFKMSLCCGFLYHATRYIQELGSYLIQCTPLVSRLMSWLRIASIFKKKPEGKILKIREDYRKAAILEMLKNFSILIENLVTMNQLEFSVKLNKIYEEKGLNLFSFVAKIIKEQSNEAISKKYLKLVSRILLAWKKGYWIIDNSVDGSIAEVYISKIKIFLNKFEYKRVNPESYYDIVDYEEVLHILASIISRSQRMKNQFIEGKTFMIYIEKFNKILKIKDLDFVELEAANSIKERGNVKMRRTGRSFVKGKRDTCCGKKEKKVSPVNSKSVQLHGTVGTKMKKSINQAIVNNLSHLQSYLLVLKSLFFNAPGDEILGKKSKKKIKISQKTQSNSNILNLITRQLQSLQQDSLVGDRNHLVPWD